jgi:hypothetical protein
MSKSKLPAATPAPHSWAITDWPAGVYPGKPDRGRYLVRSNRDSLIEAGALVRVGRDLVLIGVAYSRWLDSLNGRVAGFEVAPNRMRNQQQAA